MPKAFVCKNHGGAEQQEIVELSTRDPGVGKIAIHGRQDELRAIAAFAKDPSLILTLPDGDTARESADRSSSGRTSAWARSPI